MIIGLQVVDYSNSPRAFKVFLTIMTCLFVIFQLTQRIDVSTDRNLISWSELYWMYFVIIKFPSQ